MGRQELVQQISEPGSGERRIQFVDVEPRGVVKRGRRLPDALSHRAVLLRVVPNAAAVRTDVIGRIENRVAVNLAVHRRVFVPPDIGPVEHRLFAAVRTRHKELALIRRLVGLFDGRKPFDRRRAAVNDLALCKGFRAFDQKRNRVALLFDVRVAVIGLFHANHRSRRRLYGRRRIRPHEFQEPTRETLEVPEVVFAAFLRDRNLFGQPGRSLDHRDQLFVVEFLCRPFFGEHHDHRTGVNVDTTADVIQQHAVRPGHLRRLHGDHFSNLLVVKRFVYSPHPRRERRVIPPRRRRGLRAHSSVRLRPLRRPHFLRGLHDLRQSPHDGFDSRRGIQTDD